MVSQNFSGDYANQRSLEFRTQVYVIPPRSSLFRNHDYESGFALQGNKVNEENIPKVWLP